MTVYAVRIYFTDEIEPGDDPTVIGTIKYLYHRIDNATLRAKILNEKAEKEFDNPTRWCVSEEEVL